MSLILGKLNEVIATGFIELDEVGYFLNITDYNEQIYFSECAADIVEEGDNGFYKTDYWVLMRHG